MTTCVLTPNQPDPVTGLQDQLDGWQLTTTPNAYSDNPAMDFLVGMAVIGAMGYGHGLNSVDLTKSPPIYQLDMHRASDGHSAVVHDTDWLVTDGITAWSISDADVLSKYTITTK